MVVAREVGLRQDQRAGRGLRFERHVHGRRAHAAGGGAHAGGHRDSQRRRREIARGDGRGAVRHWPRRRTASPRARFSSRPMACVSGGRGEARGRSAGRVDPRGGGARAAVGVHRDPRSLAGIGEQRGGRLAVQPRQHRQHGHAVHRRQRLRVQQVPDAMRRLLGKRRRRCRVLEHRVGGRFHGPGAMHRGRRLRQRQPRQREQRRRERRRPRMRASRRSNVQRRRLQWRLAIVRHQRRLPDELLRLRQLGSQHAGSGVRRRAALRVPRQRVALLRPGRNSARRLGRRRRKQQRFRDEQRAVEQRLLEQRRRQQREHRQ